MLDELAVQLQKYKESLPSSLQACASAVEKLIQQLKHRISFLPHPYRPVYQLLEVFLCSGRRV